MSDLWGEDEQFLDMPEAAQTGADGKPVPASPYAPPRLPPQGPARAATSKPQENLLESEQIDSMTDELQEAPEEDFLDLQEDFSEVLTDANLRLEQGMLYKAVLNHNLFEGMDADPKAVQNVQKEIRNFAKERMEVMLGMRRESSTIERLEIDFPFNSLEVEVLKKLAFTATKGETAKADSYVPTVSRVTEEIPTVKRKTLNPISNQQPKKTALTKPLQKKPAAPVKRTRLDATIEQIAREEGVPVELLELNMAGVGGKPIHELNAAELEQRNKLAAQRRGTQVRSSSALPPPSYEQMEMKAAQQVGSFGSTPLGQRILDAVKAMPIKNNP